MSILGKFFSSPASALELSVLEAQQKMQQEKTKMQMYQMQVQAQAQMVHRAQAQSAQLKQLRQVHARSDLDNAVFKTPIDTLVNLWVAKYGTEWVEREKVLGDEFFEWAAMRLRGIGLLEEHAYWDPPVQNPQPDIALGMQTYIPPQNIQGALGGNYTLSPYANQAASGNLGGIGGAGGTGGFSTPPRHVTVLRIVLKEK